MMNNDRVIVPQNCNYIVITQDFRGVPRSPIYFITMYEDKQQIGDMLNMTWDNAKAFVDQIGDWLMYSEQQPNAFLSGVVEFRRPNKPDEVMTLNGNQ